MPEEDIVWANSCSRCHLHKTEDLKGRVIKFKVHEQQIVLLMYFGI